MCARTGSLCGLEVPAGKHCLPLAALGDVKERLQGREQGGQSFSWSVEERLSFLFSLVESKTT